MTSLIYAWPNTAAATSALDVNRDWSFTEFRAHHMRSFVEKVVKPCRTSFEKSEGQMEVIMTDRSGKRTPVPAPPTDRKRGT